MLKLIGSLGIILLSFSCIGTQTSALKTGAEQPEKYLPILEQKKVGLVVNHTSRVGETHLVDFLKQQKVEVVKIFAPEHGFRGDASAGEKIEDGVDSKTGIPVVSLYGKNRKPLPEHLADLDILVFDIQDVGCRFYTYISTLHLVMEACAENEKPLVVFDRPNPNGDYVAGPILNPKFQSFVGMHPIALVHGCTVGELAQMINGENWLKTEKSCELKVIPVANYSHNMTYSLPVPPSPNLPNDLAVRLYPSLCFFEATSVSVGRGTDFPFQVLGGLKPELGSFSFTPRSIPNAAVNPLNKDKTCYGVDLRNLQNVPPFTLKFFLDFYHQYKNEKEFLTSERWLNQLAGTDALIQQIRQGLSEAEITESWQPELEQYKKMRKNYLLYPDFE
ncbi:Uncharacterized conserved protein YbbC, DUF1343 family [Mariniphaga anaerophila]|uniref:Uncharacterized conserved protein YbbC, DUF1343 family n=1 Tax=Mariniphaga anaerophila TaxID=1484053 RepID=A0A1M4Y0D9_9BACT|nr:DUF1343 domain-containing protein [Mariniphaga anaerophila]SHE99297.1 Uncharacterized conserved protein YbbC, DUF1343 family [Mariniphaga anaerophila]